MSIGKNEQRIQDHFEDPYHRGRCERPTHFAEARNETCGDVVAVELRIIDDVVQEVWFDGEGCQLSQAVASMLVERLEGMSTDGIRSVSVESLPTLVEMEIEPKQVPCCQVTLDAIHASLEATSDEDQDDPTFGGPDLGDEC